MQTHHPQKRVTLAEWQDRFGGGCKKIFIKPGYLDKDRRFGTLKSPLEQQVTSSSITGFLGSMF